jgi:hypothetical protein
MNEQTQEEAHVDLAAQYVVDITRRVREQAERIEALLGEGESVNKRPTSWRFRRKS